MKKSKFGPHVHHIAPKTKCPDCKAAFTLLRRARPGASTCAFYICWNCRKIWEQGEGPCEDLDKKESKPV